MNQISDPSLPAGSLALVTGGRGFTGSHLVRKLAGQGARVRVLVREGSEVGHLEDLEVEWLFGDITKPEVAEQAVAGVDYIFHIAAVFRSFGLPDEVYRSVHVEGTKCLAEAALKSPSLKRFVHVSTIGVHSHIANPPADEGYPFNPDDIYQVTKAEGEKWIRGFAEKEALSLAVVRPSAIYGEGDRRLLKFFKMALKPWLVLLGPKDTCYHLIHVEDLCRCFILTAVDPRAEGEVFICGNAEPIRLSDMGRVIANVFDKKPRILQWPAKPFFMAARVCEALCRPFGIQPPLNKRRLAFYTKNRAFDTHKLRDTLGFDYVYDNEKGLAETARWYRKQGWL